MHDFFLQIKVNPVVKYEWENKYYVGNLVAVHRNGIYIAYVIKGNCSDQIACMSVLFVFLSFILISHAK